MQQDKVLVTTLAFTLLTVELLKCAVLNTCSVYVNMCSYHWLSIDMKQNIIFLYVIKNTIFSIKCFYLNTAT